MPYKDKAKQREAQRQHYLKNKDKYVERVKLRREEVKNKLRKLKGSTPCTDCGENYPYYVMQFDHVRGEKHYDLSQMARYATNWTIIENEINKCEIVCSNCHAIRTHNRIHASQV